MFHQSIFSPVGTHLLYVAVGSLPAIAPTMLLLLTSVILPLAALLMIGILSYVLYRVQWTERSWKTALLLEGLCFTLSAMPVLLLLAALIATPISWPVVLGVALLAPMLGWAVQAFCMNRYPSLLLSRNERTLIDQHLNVGSSQDKTLRSRELLKARTLLRHGSSDVACDSINALPASVCSGLLIEAASHGRLDVVNAIINIDGARENIYQEERLEALVAAVYYGHLDVAEVIFNAGGISPHSTVNGASLLYHAVMARGKLFEESYPESETAPRLEMILWLADVVKVGINHTRSGEKEASQSRDMFRYNGSALQAATFVGDQEVMTTLVVRGATVTKDLLKIAKDGDTKKHLKSLNRPQMAAGDNQPSEWLMCARIPLLGAAGKEEVKVFHEAPNGQELEGPFPQPEEDEGQDSTAASSRFGCLFG